MYLDAPTAAALDAFDRANEGPPMTGWTTWVGSGLKVVSNQCAPETTGYCTAYWSTAMSDPDVEVYVEIAVVPSNGYVEICGRVDPSAGGPGGGNFYSFYYEFAPHDYTLNREDAGIFHTLGTLNGQTLAAGDAIGIRCVGSTIQGWARVSGTWRLILEARDTTYDGTGANNKVGLQTHGGGITSAVRYDNFAGAEYRQGTPASVSDDFNRADENPLIGSPGTNWQQWGSDPQLKVVSNQVAASTSGHCHSVWIASMPADMQAFVEIGTAWNDWVGLYARYDPAGGSGYSAFYHPTDGWSLERSPGGTVLAAGGAPLLTTGDAFGIRCVGSTIEVWSRRLGVWSLTAAVRDSTHAGTGNNDQVILEIWGTTTRLDNFAAGSFTAATPLGGETPGHLSVTVEQKPDAKAIDISAEVQGLRYSTLVPGGYGSCSFGVEGDLNLWTARLPHLAKVRVNDGSQLLFEGRLEDRSISVAADGARMQVNAYGYARLLSDVSLRRIWEMRNIPWQLVSDLNGSLGSQGLTFRPQRVSSVTVGNIDETDLSVTGVQIVCTSNQSGSAGDANGVWFYTDESGPAYKRLYFSAEIPAGYSDGSISHVGIRSSTDGSSWSTDFDQQADAVEALGEIEVELTDGARFVQLIYVYTSAPAGANGGIAVKNIRLVGVDNAEDETGGFYGGTIFTDLVEQVPGLSPGFIESGSQFVVEELHRTTRSTPRSVVEEVAAYYLAEWAVWEDGRFDWTTPNLDQLEWVVQAADCISVDLEFSLEGMGRTTYVLYTNAATQLQTEESAEATRQSNPFVSTGLDRDMLVGIQFPSTSRAAARLAEVLAYLDNEYPSVTGRIVLPAAMAVRHAARGEAPAYCIRAGDNITLPDLPKSRILDGGRDGETHLHVVSTDVNVDGSTVTLQVERGLSRAAALLSRLAAITQFASSAPMPILGGGNNPLSGSFDSPSGPSPTGPSPTGPTNPSQPEIYDVPSSPRENPIPGGPIPYY